MDFNFLLVASGSYKEGDARLAGGAVDREGRVEIFLEGQWGTLNSEEWDKNDAQVVCKQLKFSIESGEKGPYEVYSTPLNLCCEFVIMSNIAT